VTKRLPAYRIVAGPELSPSEDNRVIKVGGYPINIVGGRKLPQAAKLDRDLRPTDKSDWRINYQPGDLGKEWTARELARRAAEQENQHGD
jgi:hypothetical protein